MSGGVFGGSGSFGADVDFSLDETDSAFRPDMEFSLEEAKAATLPYEQFTATTGSPLVLTNTNVKPVSMAMTLPLTPMTAVNPPAQASSGMSTAMKVGLAVLGLAAVGAAVYVATADKPLRANPTKRRTSRRLPAGSAPRSKPRVRRNGSRPRTTRDEFEVRGNYGFGHGFEMVTTEDTRKEAKERLREYRDNEPGIPFKIVRVRVPLQ